MKKLIFLLLLFLFLPSYLFAQQPITPASAIDQLKKYQQNFPLEKLYLSFDKSYYNAGDTIWFKSILLNDGSKLSNKIYVELFNDSLKRIDNRVIALNNGLGFGDFSLNNKLPNGNYTIRAYSNWQQNFGEDYFFQKNLYIGNTTADRWLLNTNQKLYVEDAKYILDIRIRLTNLKNEPQGLQDIEAYVLNDKKRLMHTFLQTKLDGSFTAKIPIGEKITGKYELFIVEKKNAATKITMPLFLDSEDKIDFQFMPEGGYMINGIYGKVAFKILGSNGLGRALKGKIINSKNEIITDFATLHNGMGNFHLLPQKGEYYTAIYSINGKENRQKLPIAKDEGTSLRIVHLSNPDSLLLYIKVSENKKTEKKYLLVAQNNEKIFLKADLNLINGFNNLRLAKKAFPDGIIHFTLFSPEQQPLNERQAFINWQQHMNLTIKANKNNYESRDSVSLEVTATNEDGSPLIGSFSLSVTDNNQVKQPIDEEHIISYFLLQHNLKGNIEDAGWYFNHKEPETLMALDNLLLTQAWVGYNWQQILTPNLSPKFKLENENIIEGRLTNLLKKPVPDINVFLLSVGKKISITDTLSNHEGKFMFKNLPLIDTIEYVIKIRKQKGRTANALISMDEFEPPANIRQVPSVIPWYVNTDTTTLNYYKTSAIFSQQQEQLTGKNRLKTVEIKGVRDPRDEDIFWGTDIIKEVSEAELKKNPRKTLMDVLKESVPGFGISRFWASCYKGSIIHDYDAFVVNSYPLTSVVVDKTSTNLGGGMNEVEIFDLNNGIFTYLHAADIKHIAIRKGCGSYMFDISTRGGKGPWVAQSPSGIYVYKPLPLYFGKEFYSPKYTVDKNLSQVDLRSTIYWNANVVTDKDGKAKVSFYTADLPGTYTIKIEGTDLAGRFGYRKSTLDMGTKKESK